VPHVVDDRVAEGVGATYSVPVQGYLMMRFTMLSTC
jgi:hypothetical protein